MMTHSYISSEMESPDLIRTAQGQVAVMSRACPGKKRENEDCAAIIPITRNSVVLMVADGVGGHVNGSVASSFMTRLLENRITDDDSSAISLRESILSSIEKTNLTLLRKETGEATTVAIVEITGNRLRSYHVGDSEVLVTGQRGKLKLQTVPHSPVGYAMESGLLEEDEAIRHSDRHYVSNIVGQDDMHITVSSQVKLGSRDTVLLGTDGVFDNLYKDEVMDIIRKGPLDRAANKLWKLIEKRMQEMDGEKPSKPDDMTFILYRPVNLEK